MEHRKLVCDLQTGISWLTLWAGRFLMWTWQWLQSSTDKWLFDRLNNYHMLKECILLWSWWIRLKIYTYVCWARSAISWTSDGSRQREPRNPTLSVSAKSCKDTMSELYICTNQEENINVFQIFSSRFVQNTSYKLHKVIIYVTYKYKT